MCDDSCQAVMRLLDTPAAVGEVVNVGGTEEVSILDLAHRIRNKVGSSAEPQLVPYDDVFPYYFEDMQRRVPSTTKLRTLTGFSPCTDLDHVLDDVIAHHRAGTDRVERRILVNVHSKQADGTPYSRQFPMGSPIARPSIVTKISDISGRQ